MIREILEEPPATAEQDRYLVEDELVDESRRERILDAGGDQGLAFSQVLHRPVADDPSNGRQRRHEEQDARLLNYFAHPVATASPNSSRTTP